MKRILAACVLLLMGGWAAAQVNGQGGVYVNGVLQGAAGSGTVTSVGLNLAANASSIFGVTNSPVTTSGNFLFAFANVSAAKSLLGPMSGADAAATFRAIATTDLVSPDAAGVLTSDGAGTLSWEPAGGSGANTALSNLASVAINTSLLPGVDNAYGLGSATYRWVNGYGDTFFLGGVSSYPGSSLDLTAALASASASAQAGSSVNVTGSDARPGDTNPGAAAGGPVVVVGGNAARLSSGNANGGDVTLTPGTGIGTGRNGQVIVSGGTPVSAVGLVPAAPTTDVAPSASLLRGADAFPGATGGNATGANTILAGGIGKRIFTVVDYSQGSMAGSTVTITLNGSVYEKVEGDGEDWLTATDNATTATSLAAAIDVIPGVSAVAVAAVIRIVPDPGTYSLTIAKTAADAGMTATSGTNGMTQTAGDLLLGTTAQVRFQDYASNDLLIFNGASFAAGFELSPGVGWSYGPALLFYNSTGNPIRMGDNQPGGMGSLVQALNLASGTSLNWNADVGFVRSAVGVVKVYDGVAQAGGPSATGSGNIEASTAITAVGTAAANGYIRTGVYKRAWTNAEVTAFGAVLSGDLKVATLPAKTVVRNAYLVIDSQASGTTTLTASLGRTSTAYVDYIVASDAKVSANTVYGDVRSVTDQFTYSFFDLATDLPATLDVPSIYVNRAGAKIVTEVYCEADTADGAVINLTNAGDTVLSSDLTCTTAGAASTSFVSGKNAVALNAKLSHVTVSVLAGLRRLNVVVKYTNVSGEGGTNLNGYDVPSSTATTDIYVQFVATDATKKLADVLGCTGTVYLMTETVP